MKALVFVLLLAGCSGVDTSDWVIYMKDGDPKQARLENASDRPLVIFLQKDGSSIRLPEGVKGGQ